MYGNEYLTAAITTERLGTAPLGFCFVTDVVTVALPIEGSGTAVLRQGLLENSDENDDLVMSFVSSGNVLCSSWKR